MLVTPRFELSEKLAKNLENKNHEELVRNYNMI